MIPTTFQLVTFGLAGITDEAYRASAEQAAPTFAAMPGLVSKLWLADPSTGTYGGAYAWRERTAMEAYLGGEVYAAMRANPGLRDVTSRHFELLPEPTAITAGRAAVVS